MTFDECLKKHFPLGYQTHAVISQLTNSSIEQYTLYLLNTYDGSYDLEDTMLGILIIHTRLGNIKGHDIDYLLKELNWSPEFEYDIKYRLKLNSNTRGDCIDLGFEEIGRYDYDGNGNVSIDGGYDRNGYNRDGYDEEGLDELGYQEDYELD